MHVASMTLHTTTGGKVGATSVLVEKNEKNIRLYILILQKYWSYIAVL